MTKWPEPEFRKSSQDQDALDALEGVTHGLGFYSEIDVRSIVRAEMEPARSLIQATVSSLDDTLEDSAAILNELLPHAGWERFDRQIAQQRSTIEKANEILSAARKWLKENTNADR